MFALYLAGGRVPRGLDMEKKNAGDGLVVVADEGEERRRQPRADGQWDEDPGDEFEDAAPLLFVAVVGAHGVRSSSRSAWADGSYGRSLAASDAKSAPHP